MEDIKIIKMFTFINFILLLFLWFFLVIIPDLVSTQKRVDEAFKEIKQIINLLLP